MNIPATNWGDDGDDFAAFGAAASGLPAAALAASTAAFAAAPAHAEPRAIDPQLLVRLRREAQQLGAGVRSSIGGSGGGVRLSH